MTIAIRHVPLPVQWPDARLGTPAVLVQPDLSDLVLTATGYQHPAPQRARQLAILKSALERAGEGISPDLPHAFFVALSEYALPSAAFEACDEAVDRLLPANAVCMAGLDAMSPERWCKLLESAENGLELREQQARYQYDWVNAAVVWVKDSENKLHRFFQAKIRRAERECRGDMYPGSEVLSFDAGSRSFAVLICFDYIANPNPNEPDVAGQLAAHMQQHNASGGLLFVLQCNDRPGHAAFVEANQTLFNDRAHRMDAVLYVNQAGRSGFSRMYFAKEDWAPTTRNTEIDLVPEVYRRMPVADRLFTEVSLRSGEAAVHSFVYTRRADLPANAGAERSLLTQQRLYRIRADGSTERVPVPMATTFELGEALKQVPPRRYDDPPKLIERMSRQVLDRLDTEYGHIKSELEQLDLHRLHTLMQIFWQGLPNPDFWSEGERADLRRLIQTLYVLGAGDMDLQVWAQAASDLISARCRHFTVTILAGNEDVWTEDLYVRLPEAELNRLPGTHIIFLLHHFGPSPKNNQPEAIDLRALRRVGAGLAARPVPDYDGEFGNRAEWEKIDPPRLYWYDRDCLLDRVRRAESKDDLTVKLQEVFPWQVA